MRTFLIGLLAAATLTACGSAGEQQPGSTPSKSDVTGTITVLAAASLTETFTALGKEFERAHPGTTVKFSFGASSTLAQQITNGAPADVFAAASPATMKQVGAAATAPRVFVRNRLQIAVPQGNPAKVTGLKDFADGNLKISLCAKEVPCGTAATKAFDAAKITPKPDTFGTDVKAVLTSVRLGEADAGLVYRTDVKAAGSEVQGLDFPEASKAINDCPLSALAGAPNERGAMAFVAFILSSASQRTFTVAGFDLP